ncbi:helix-turn-helix transcriptional regulator [Aestuariivirga sp.]|uniref:helix-turn-helix transcriptional regulator n=1 Tax=Aestuariivirga sp. TaxID=2650926 RepID=UPI0039E5F49B
MVAKFLRFKDLKERGIVNNWPALIYKIKNNGFPQGRYIGPNSRAWTEDEVKAWLEKLPVSKPVRNKNSVAA